MVDGQHTNAVPVCELLEPADDFIITGIAVSLAARFTDFLHGVNDNELGIRMLPHEVFKLLIKTVPHLICRCCKMKIICVLHAIHHKHPALDALEIILQRQIQHRSLMDSILPELLPCADMIGKLRHKERLADLRCSGQDIRPGVEQAVDNRRPALVGCLIQLSHGNGMEMIRVCHALHPLVHSIEIFFRIFNFVIEFLLRSGYTANRNSLNGLPFICANRCFKGSLFFRISHHR